MSPLFRDRLLVSLAPDSVALARVGGTFKPRLASRQAVECDPAFGTEPWAGAVAALAGACEPLKSERLNVTVVLSNHFVRYLTIPRDAAIAAPAEALALARFHFAKVYGERAKSWDLRLSQSAAGRPGLAGAVDAALIEALRSAFPPKGKMRLASVQPYLMSAFNQWKHEVVKEDAWLLLIEPRRACLALMGSGGCRSVHAARGDFDTPESWAALLDRQQLRLDAAASPRKVLVHAPAHRKPIGGEAQGWRFLGLLPPALEGFRPLEDGPFTMALSCR